MRLEVIHSEVLFKNKKHNVYTDTHLMTYEYVPIMITFLIVNVNNIKQLYTGHTSGLTNISGKWVRKLS